MDKSAEGKPRQNQPKPKWKQVEELKDKLELDKMLNEYEYSKNYFDGMV